MSYEKLNNFVLSIRKLQELDLDVFIITSAPKGFGKSSTIIQISRSYIELFGLRCLDCKKKWVYTGNAFAKSSDGFKLKENLKESCPSCGGENVEKQASLDFEKHLAYDNNEIEDRIYNLEPYSPVLGDEGVRFLMGEDWNTYESKRLKKLFSQCRTKRLLIFANIPKFVWVDKKYRNSMTTWWIRIIKRGVNVLMQPDLGEIEDPWHIKEFAEMLGSYFYFTPDEEIYKKLETMKSKLQCVYDYFKVPPVPQEIYAEYLKARNKKVFERQQRESEAGQKDLAKICCWNLVNRWVEFMASVKKSRFDKPTLQLMEDILFLDPVTNERQVGYTTIRNWINEIDKTSGKAATQKIKSNDEAME